MSKNTKLINFSDTHLNMVEELKKRTGIKSLTAIVINGLVAYHKSYFPAYASNSSPLSEEDVVKQAVVKAKAKKALADAEELERLRPKINICENLLHGEVKTDEKGFRYCHFTQFRKTQSEDKPQMIPLRQVDPILAETMLFMPSKESVLKSRADLRKKLKV